MNEWDITQQLLVIEAAKTDVILQRRLNELGWQHVPEGYVLVPVNPDKNFIYTVREILEESNWRLHVNNVRELHNAVIQTAQEEE